MKRTYIWCGDPMQHHPHTWEGTHLNQCDGTPPIKRLIAEYAEQAQLAWQAPRSERSDFVSNSLMAQHQRRIIHRRARLNGDRRIMDIWLPEGVDGS